MSFNLVRTKYVPPPDELPGVARNLTIACLVFLSSGAAPQAADDVKWSIPPPSEAWSSAIPMRARCSHQMFSSNPNPQSAPVFHAESKAIERAEIFSTAPGDSSFRGVSIDSHQLGSAVAAESVARLGILWGIIALRVRWPATIHLRDSRGKEENLQIRRSSGSNLHFWMAVQPSPVRSVAHTVSSPLPPVKHNGSTHIALQIHLPLSRTWENCHSASAA